MKAPEVVLVLNELLRLLCRSLPAYLADAKPWAQSEDQQLRAALDHLVADQQRYARLVSDAIAAHGGRPDPGRFAMQWTAKNDLSLGFLVQEIIVEQERDVAAIAAVRRRTRRDRLAALLGRGNPRQRPGTSGHPQRNRRCQAMKAEGKQRDPKPGSANSSLGVPPAVFFDTHAHLDQPEFDADRSGVIARAKAAGVETILCPAVSAASSRGLLQLGEEFDLPVAVGIHPNSTAEAAADDWQQVALMSSHPRVVALGETGLDRYWDLSPLTRQQEYLDRHLRLAQEQDLPVILHCRDAAAELMPMLREAAGRGPLRGVLHAFSGDADLAAECVALGFFISFAGNITYTNRKFDSLRAAARTVPDDRLLL